MRCPPHQATYGNARPRLTGECLRSLELQFREAFGGDVAGNNGPRAIPIAADERRTAPFVREHVVAARGQQRGGPPATAGGKPANRTALGLIGRADLRTPVPEHRGQLPSRFASWIAVVTPSPSLGGIE